MATVTEIRPGLLSFGDDDWRAELGPRFVKMRVGDDPAAEFASHGIPLRYLQEGKDALGKPIKPGEECHFYTWLAADRIWHVYRWEKEQWSLVETKDVTQEKIVAHVTKLMET